MNPLPSRSCDTNSSNYNTPKMVSRKIYIPNLSTPRTREVKTKENVEAKKEVTSFSTVEHYYFQTKKFLQRTETFAARLNTSNSDIAIKNRPKITDSTSSNHLDDVKAGAVCSDESSNEDPRVAKSCASKFALISSKRPLDLPISIPRPRLSSPNNTINFSDLNQGESFIFILKTPKYLPGILDGSMLSEASSSKNESQKCTMGDLPEGQIGTLQITKSNRLRLVLGECAFWLHRGVSVAFKEELAVVNADPETQTGKIVNFGVIKDRIIAVPESVTTFTNDNTC